MGNVIKLDKTGVNEALSKIKMMIDVSEDDLKAFENVGKAFLTDQNTSASKRLKRLAETNDEKAKGRKATIENAVANLRTAYAALTRYSEAMGM